MPAQLASTPAVCSSLLVEVAVGLLREYRLPHASEPIATGTPRKLCIGGWPGEAVRPGMVAHVMEPQRHRVADQSTQYPVALGQVADRAARLLIDALRDEALERSSTTVQHPYGGVTCAA